MNKTISITVDAEEWFHSEWFTVEKVINKYYGGKYPKTDVVDCTKSLIELFNRYNVRATFFVLGETAQRYPNLINLIKDNNHEIACHGYYHNKPYYDLSEFKKDIKYYKSNIEDNMLGFRSPNFSISKGILQIICEEGFSYDSSIVPCISIPGWYGNSDSPIQPYDINQKDYLIREFPIAVFPILRIPGGGGWFFRNIGYFWVKSVIKAVLNQTGHATIYLHPWEVSNINPVYKEIPFYVFRNTGEKMLNRIEKIIKYFNNINYISLSDLFIDLSSNHPPQSPIPCVSDLVIKD
jgi:polysaccharide deacetylase family protein (PEP-CTERM system associated)